MHSVSGGRFLNLLLTCISFKFPPGAQLANALVASSVLFLGTLLVHTAVPSAEAPTDGCGHHPWLSPADCPLKGLPAALLPSVHSFYFYGLQVSYSYIDRLFIHRCKLREHSRGTLSIGQLNMQINDICVLPEVRSALDRQSFVGCCFIFF